MTLTEATISLDSILLDPNNYRFIDNDKFKKKIEDKFHVEAAQDQTLQMLEKTESYQISELKKSILNNGFVPIEKVVVKKYGPVDGKFVVVEGNRRVATLKILLKENSVGVIQLNAEQVAQFSTINCLVLEDANLREAERTIMGIRHIAGAKGWGAYQQAQLIHELVDEEGHEIDQVAEKLGMTKVEANKRYRAMKALRQMEVDEEYHEKAKKDHYQLFRELVTTPGVRETFGWSQEDSKFSDLHKARQFFELISPQTDGSFPKLVTYNDVRRLKLILESPLAVEALLDPDRPFAEAIAIAEPEMKTRTGVDSSTMKNYFNFINAISVDTLLSLSKEQSELLQQIAAKTSEMLELREKMLK